MLCNGCLLCHDRGEGTKKAQNMKRKRKMGTPPVVRGSPSLRQQVQHEKSAWKVWGLVYTIPSPSAPPVTSHRHWAFCAEHIQIWMGVNTKSNSQLTLILMLGDQGFLMTHAFITLSPVRTKKKILDTDSQSTTISKYGSTTHHTWCDQQICWWPWPCGHDYTAVLQLRTHLWTLKPNIFSYTEDGRWLHDNASTMHVGSCLLLPNSLLPS